MSQRLKNTLLLVFHILYVPYALGAATIFDSIDNLTLSHNSNTIF
jgi:hypothetical protein